MKNCGFAMAFRTLTRFPFPLGGDDVPERSLFWFPFVGASIGLFLYAAARLPLPVSVRAALVIALSAYLTRGFHLDGLADFADGLGGGWTRERALQIMRDSHSGAFAVITVCVVLLLQFSALIHLVDGPRYTLFIFPAFGRLMQVYGASFLPYARSTEGTASSLVRRSKPRHAMLPTLQALSLLALLFLFSDTRFAWATLCAYLTAGLVTLSVLCIASKRLGGVTGDVLGAIEVLGESSAMLGFLFVLA